MTGRALVTGAGGFIGRHMVEALRADGREVVGLFRSDESAEERAKQGLVAWSNGGITEATLSRTIEGVDEVYHCAGSGSVALSLAEPQNDFESNVISTQTLLEFLRRKHSHVRLVLPSSAGVYGNVPNMPITTSTPCEPISPYGANKWIGEILAQQYARHFGLNISVVRLFSVYGRGIRKQLLWDACRKLHSGKRQFFGTGDETRDWVHVGDAVRLMIFAAAAATPQILRVNGGSGEARTIREVLNRLAAELSIHDPITFDGQVRAGDPAHYQADITEARALGWYPRIGLHEGISDYARWFLRSETYSAATESGSK